MRKERGRERQREKRERTRTRKKFGTYKERKQRGSGSRLELELSPHIAHVAAVIDSSILQVKSEVAVLSKGCREIDHGKT